MDPALTLQDMMDQGPEWLGAYLRQFEEGKPIPHSMIGIEAGAASRARSLKNLQWADIAVRAAALHALESEGEQRAAALWKAMAIRAWFISEMGSRRGHPILDPDIILQWFESETEFSMDVTKQKSARWKNFRASTMTRDELAEFRSDLIKLRNIKQRISVLKMLAGCGELPEDARFKHWLEIRDQIP
jgi:hypothetical protein